MSTTVDVVGILSTMDAGSRVARETRGRWYNWRKDKRGYWKLIDRPVWLTNEEMANSPISVQFAPTSTQ